MAMEVYWSISISKTSNIDPDCIESIILKIIGKTIDNLPCHIQSIIRSIANNKQKIHYF